MSTPNQQQSPQSGRSRKRRRSSSLSSSSSSDVVIILDHDGVEPEPSKPPQRSDPTAKRSEGDNQQDNESQVLEELRQARDVLRRHRGTADATSGAVHARRTNEKEVEYIPGLVNRVLCVESNREGGLKRSVAMTELLVDLVLGFVEPHVMQVSKERINASNETKSSNMYNDDGRFLSSTTSDVISTEYRDRAIGWAIERIKDLLRPVDVGSGTDIPELDALLSASGRYDGLVHERNVQERLREVLGRMKPMLSAAKGGEGSDLADLIEKCRSTNSETAKKNGEGPKNEEPTPSPTSVAKCWSVSPEQWMEKVTNTTTEDNNTDETDSMNEAMESFPYLRQMKDFLKKA